VPRNQLLSAETALSREMPVEIHFVIISWEPSPFFGSAIPMHLRPASYSSENIFQWIDIFHLTR
jgi:hypothetical protein